MKVMRKVRNRKKGFLLLEILISALILAGAVAAGMYLFRMGFQYLEKIKENNLLSSKVPQAISYLSKVADLEKESGEVSLGEAVKLSWEAKLVEKIRPQIPLPEGGFSAPYELYLYEVNFDLISKNLTRTYKTYITRYKMLTAPEVFF